LRYTAGTKITPKPMPVDGPPTHINYLPREHAAAAFSFAAGQNFYILKGAPLAIRLNGADLRAADFTAEFPPRWDVKFAQAGADVVCTVTAPAETEARTGRVMIRNKKSGELVLTLPIMSPVSAETALLGRDAEGQPGIRVDMVNNGAEAKTVNWTVELIDAWPMVDCGFTFNQPGKLEAYLKGDTEGQATLDGGATRVLELRVADFAPQTVYKVRTTITDAEGRRTVSERYAGGFAVAKRLDKGAKLDKAFWDTCQPEYINTINSVFRFGARADTWKGPEDLSAVWRCAWDDDNFYMLVDVTDDVYSIQHADGAIWNQDGLQFLFDPPRTQAEKAGKYDISVGYGKGKGPQAWYNLTAHHSIPEGDATSKYKISIADWPAGGAGGKRYTLAIPWNMLAPFKPASGANLGMGMILNEDDGNGRVGFNGWFSGPHSKNLDDVGDVILE